MLNKIKTHSMATFKKISKKIQERTEAIVSLLLLNHIETEHRYGKRGINNPYYCEAFGVMRGVQLMGYGYWGPDHGRPDQMVIDNLKWWFHRIEEQVETELANVLGEGWEERKNTGMLFGSREVETLVKKYRDQCKEFGL